MGAQSALSALIKDLGIDGRLRLHEIGRRWGEIFPGPLGVHTSPASLREGSHLLVHVDSSAWLQQVEFLRPAVVEKLRPLGITGVRFMLGRVQAQEKAPIPPDQPQVPLSDDDYRFIEQCVSLVSDETIRETLRRAISYSIRQPRVERKPPPR